MVGSRLDCSGRLARSRLSDLRISPYPLPGDPPSHPDTPDGDSIGTPRASLRYVGIPLIMDEGPGNLNGVPIRGVRGAGRLPRHWICIESRVAGWVARQAEVHPPWGSERLAAEATPQEERATPQEEEEEEEVLNWVEFAQREQLGRRPGWPRNIGGYGMRQGGHAGVPLSEAHKIVVSTWVKAGMAMQKNTLAPGGG